ncbi:MAG TPA: LCP family protein [Actinophytocola sp.]|uniref:LCP family protein n=1 Tax=Actinophytocola sp. TaxID=1872138 RepID=UPI002DFEA26F|nr:LCP family protein [Actinophytocola sp.]
MDESAQEIAEEPDAGGSDQAASRSRRVWLRQVGLGTGRTLAALVSVGVLGTMGYGWWAFGDVDEATVTTDVIDPQVAEADNHHVPLDGAVDMLLVGMDSRTDAYGNPLPKAVMDLLHAGINDGERNTDTMILVHIPVDGTRAVAFSFPRDSWVEIAGGFGKHKLNSAFAYAYNNARGKLNRTVTDSKELEAQAAAVGRKNLIATVEQLIGNAVTIDRYAEVNLASFYEITQAIGGVDVCLNAPVDERKSGARFPAGRQTISGAQALSFVRQRYELPNGDLDRIVRQQVFLGALAGKVLSADMLTSPTKVRELISAVQRSVVLSKGWELSTFAAQMQGLSSGNIDFYTIPTQGAAKIGGADVIRVDPAEVHQFVAALTNDGTSERNDSPDLGTTPGPTGTTTTTRTPVTTTTPPAVTPPALQPGSITVDVRNAAQTRGLAGTVEDRLVRLGFRRGTTGDAAVQAVSVIQYPSGEQYSAQLVANALGQQLAFEPDLSLTPGHVRVILGTDYPTVQPQGFAARAPTTSSPPATTSTNQPTPIVAGRLTCVN